MPRFYTESISLEVKLLSSVIFTVQGSSIFLNKQFVKMMQPIKHVWTIL